MPDSSSTATDSTDSDPTQIIPPWIDSGMTIKGMPARHLGYAIPGLLLAIGGFFAILYGGLVGIGAATMGLGLLVAAIGAGVSVGTDYSVTSAADRLIAPLRFRRLRRSLPRTQEEAATIHGVKRIFDDGLARLEDGHLVGLVRIEGRNTDLQEDAETRPMIGTLRTAIDEDVMEFDFDLYSTSVAFDPAEITEPFEQQWHDGYAGDRWRWMRRYLWDLIQWEESVSRDLYESRDWHHYGVVAVTPWSDDVGMPSFEDADVDIDEERYEAIKRRQMHEEVTNRLSKLGDAFAQVSGIRVHDVGPAEHATLLARRWSGVEHDFDAEAVTRRTDVAVWPHRHSDEPAAGDPAEEPARPGAVTASLDEDDRHGATAAVTHPNADTVAFETDGGAADQPVASSTQAHADPAADDELSPDEQRDASFFARVRDGLFGLSPLSDGGDAADPFIGDPHIGDLLGPSSYDVTENHVRVGNQFVKTFWIADWPTEPREKFLQELYTMQGVDVEVTLRCVARDKQTVKAEMKGKIGEVDADIGERKERNDLSAMLEERDVDPYTRAYILLHETPAQPWDLTGYVTVRTGEREALDRAQEYVEQGLLDEESATPDLAKRQNLADDVDTVTAALERSPAQTTPVTSDHQQDLLFRSAAPGGPDVYAQRSHRSRSRPTLSGAIAAAFPPSAPHIRQDDGICAGRLTTNGSAVLHDPFTPGPAHQLVVGNSGSGKTVWTSKQALRWWAKGEDRTLIFCDTMGEFGGITEVCNGQRITLDGKTTINPLHIERTPDEVLQHLDVDPFEMKFQSAINFLLSVISTDPAKADQFAPLVKDAVRETYRAAGVIPEDPSTHRAENSPTMTDLRTMIERMGEHPTDYVTSDLEAEEIEANAGKLLRRLSGFRPDGDMRSLTGESEAQIQSGGVTYLDLQHVEGSGLSADKSTMLMLMLGQVYQAVKRSPGETLFVIDEAHYLLQSEEMLAWLQQAARHWRHYEAGLWFVSQQPADFVEGRTAAIQEYLDAIRGQTTATTFFSTDDLESSTADRYGLNARQEQFIREEATAGVDGKGYTDALMRFAEREGWHRLTVRTASLEQLIFDYDPERHGSFVDLMAHLWDDRTRSVRHDADDRLARIEAGEATASEVR